MQKYAFNTLDNGINSVLYICLQYFYFKIVYTEFAKHYRACSPILRETILKNLLKYKDFSENFDDYFQLVKVI